MRQQNSVDNGLIFAYDIARHSRASRKLGLGRLLGCLLTIAVLLLLQGVICPSGYADNFPGKGSRQAWLRANRLYNEGTELNEQGKYHQAVSKLKEAIALYPYEPSYHHNLGYACEKKGDLGLAEFSYRAALKLNPTRWQSWDALKNVLYKQGRFKDSKDACLSALKCNPPEDAKQVLRSALGKLSNKLNGSGSLAGAAP
jgi:tetratricopeptide (TPR) repeat protein